MTGFPLKACKQFLPSLLFEVKLKLEHQYIR